MNQELPLRTWTLSAVLAEVPPRRVVLPKSEPRVSMGTSSKVSVPTVRPRVVRSAPLTVSVVAVFAVMSRSLPADGPLVRRTSHGAAGAARVVVHAPELLVKGVAGEGLSPAARGPG